MADTNTQQHNAEDFGDQINQELKKLLRDKKNVQPAKIKIKIKANRRSQNLGQTLNTSDGKDTETENEDELMQSETEKGLGEATSIPKNKESEAYEPERALKLQNPNSPEGYKANQEEKPKSRQAEPAETGSKQNNDDININNKKDEGIDEIASESENETKAKIDQTKREAKNENEEQEKPETTDMQESADQTNSLETAFGPTRWLQWSWDDLFSGFTGSFGLSLLYINFHFIMSYIANSSYFCKFGDKKSENFWEKLYDSETGRIVIMFLADILIIMLITTLIYAGYSALPWLAKKCIENGDNWVGQTCTAGAKTISNAINTANNIIK